MRKSSSWWILVGFIIIGVILLLRSNIENFTTINPLLSQTDVTSLVPIMISPGNWQRPTPTATASTFINWFKTNITNWPINMSDNDKTEFISNIVGGNPMDDTPKTFLNLQNIISQLSTKPSIDDYATKLISTLPSKNNSIINIDNIKLAGTQVGINGYPNPVYWSYIYYFGSPSSNSSPNSQSCNPSYKSIPGGTMEQKCFTS